MTTPQNTLNNNFFQNSFQSIFKLKKTKNIDIKFLILKHPEHTYMWTYVQIWTYMCIYVCMWRYMYKINGMASHLSFVILKAIRQWISIFKIWEKKKTLGQKFYTWPNYHWSMRAKDIFRYARAQKNNHPRTLS